LNIDGLNFFPVERVSIQTASASALKTGFSFEKWAQTSSLIPRIPNNNL